MGDSRSGGSNPVAALDQAAAWRIAGNDSRLPGLVPTRLGRLAGHGMLWTGLAIGLWLTGDRWARRAAWRGMGGMAAASAAATMVGKSSARAASGAAFATGVALEKSSLAAPAIVLAAAVGASEAITGEHQRSDVLAGLAIGAAAGVMTLRWWPRRPPVPAAAVRPPYAAPVAPAGRGLVLAVNTSAGTASPKLAGRLRAELPEATILEVSAGHDLARQLRPAAAEARILGVAGGDGTVNVASSVALEAGVPLLVIPAGTFNHFAADLGVRSVEDALAALRAGEAVMVDVGVAGRRSFINTSSTGVYVDLVHAREQLENRLGRRLAVVAALVRVLWRGRPHELILNGQHRRLWLYFAGNCRYEPVGTAPAYRPDLADGYLDIRLIVAGPLARWRIVAAVITGTLARCRVYQAWQARAVDVSSAHGAPIWLSVDGEVATAESSFRQGKRPQGLLIYRRAASPPGGMPAAPRWLRGKGPGRRPPRSSPPGIC